MCRLPSILFLHHSTEKPKNMPIPAITLDRETVSRSKSCSQNRSAFMLPGVGVFRITFCQGCTLHFSLWAF